jgi:hypothetical protein
MDPVRATTVSNYGRYVTWPGPDGVLGTPDDRSTAIAAAAYNGATHQAVLTLASPLPFGVFYVGAFDVGAVAGSGRGLTDLSGVLLNGSGQGAGTPYVFSFGEGTGLTYVDHAADTVSLWLTGPGLIAVVRNASGDAQSVRVLGPTPGVTALNGAVRRPPAGSTAPVTIPTITGASGVAINLRPPFVIGGVSPSAVDHLSASGALTAKKALKR